jgi:hypothetical protein
MKASAVVLGLLISAPLPAAPAGPSPNGIHAVDFRNFTFFPSCANFESEGEPKIPVKAVDGMLQGAAGDLQDVTFEVREVVYGDLTGDGKDEAVVMTLCSTGGSGWFDEGLVYTMKAGRATLAGRLPGGDRAAGSVRCARVEEGALKAERVGNDVGSALGIEFVDTETWRLQGGLLVEAGEPVRRRLHTGKAQPVRFEKGATSAAVRGKTATAGEYVLRARDGQTMTVGITAKDKNAAFEIMLDDATLACRTTKWTGKTSFGEYRITVVATRGTADYVLHVSIR